MLLWRIIYSQGSVDELRCRSATNEFNIWRMLSKPVRYPSSWLPSRHGLRWSISIPSGTRCVLAKSIIHIPAFVLSCMNNKDVPMSCQNQLRLVEAVRWIEKKEPDILRAALFNATFVFLFISYSELTSWLAKNSEEVSVFSSCSSRSTYLSCSVTIETRNYV